jgi:hypothetical protein
MSGELYKEFVKPYNECLLKAFGGGCIHYCGQSTQNISNYVHTEGVRAIHNLNLDNISAAAAMRNALKDKGIVYMACDFAPSEQRMEAYYRELERAMGGPEGLIIASYIAPAISLDKGRYEAVSRDRTEVSRRVFGLLKRG